MLNTMYLLEANGLRLLHMGDNRAELPPAVLREVRMPSELGGSTMFVLCLLAAACCVCLCVLPCAGSTAQARLRMCICACVFVQVLVCLHGAGCSLGR